jgi:hypothetical protein
MKNDTKKNPLILKRLQSTGCWAVYEGSRALGGTNTDDLKKAVAFTEKNFPGRTIRIKNFYKALN